MKVLSERHFEDAKFSLYFLGSGNVPDNVDCKDLFQPVLELTHNHGTETDSDFKHYNGNEDGRQGFGHIGFLVDDVYAACDAIRIMGYGFRKVRGLILPGRLQYTWCHCILVYSEPFLMHVLLFAHNVAFSVGA
jgi:catechol 2,3-dioxygenase-like lactoylglutathione lyase family enzyme